MLKKSNSTITCLNEYLSLVPQVRHEYFVKLRTTISDNIPTGFQEQIDKDGIAQVVPHSIYPEGYHCDPKSPLPFISIASQKNFIGLYHMGMYANPELYNWFTHEYPKHCKFKLDMGKSCVRFKKIEHIPYELIADLVQRVTLEDWLNLYKGIVKR